MRAERTFWEKATAVHVFCHQEKLEGQRFVRHWHDLVRLDGHAEPALADRVLAVEVANHKAMFFAENDEVGRQIDYMQAVSGSLKLVPEGNALDLLRGDYEKMVESGLLLRDEAHAFDDLMTRCRALETRANKVN
jgi:hypothetical protein